MHDCLQILCAKYFVAYLRNILYKLENLTINFFVTNEFYFPLLCIKAYNFIIHFITVVLIHEHIYTLCDVQVIITCQIASGIYYLKQFAGIYSLYVYFVG